MLPDLKLFDYTNYMEISEYFKYSPKHMSLASFSTQFIWRNQTGLSYCIDEDMLFLFETNFCNAAICPMGTGDLEKAIYKIKTTGNTKIVYCIGEEQKEILNDSYKICCFRDFFEYAYLTQNLIELSGRKYSKKRNHIHKFTSLYQYEYKKIDMKDSNEIKKVIDKWCENKECEENSQLFHEKNAVVELLTNKAGIEYKAASLYINGDMVAFSIGEKISDDMAVIHFEKADTNYQGLYQMMAWEFLKNEWQDVKYVNRQEDMGIPGLRKAKESYHPDLMVKNYCIRFD